MNTEVLAYAFGVPVAFILSNLISFWISKKLETSVNEGLEEITRDWLTFFNNGIPIPADQNQTEGTLLAAPAFVQPAKESFLPGLRRNH